MRFSNNMAVEGTISPVTGTSPTVVLAFAPVHKAALGVALGAVSGLAVFAITAFHVVFNPVDALDIGLLRQYFYGYHVTWEGACVGFFWGFVSGFVTGWFIAFVRNLVIAISVFTVRAKADLAQTRDFLDHI